MKRVDLIPRPPRRMLQPPKDEIRRRLEVAQAQAAFELWRPEDGGPPPLAHPGRITAVVGEDAHAALAVLGVSRVEDDEA